MEDLKKRKTPRWQKYDYNCASVYFITICTKDRKCILSRVVGTGGLDCPKTDLTKYGEIAEKYINQINDFYDNISIEEYVIMPDHIHLLLWVKEGDVEDNCVRAGTSVSMNVARANNGCSKIISTFKRFCNKEYGENIWQDRFFDHIIRNHDDYLKHVEYIHENPIKWYYEKKQPEE